MLILILHCHARGRFGKPGAPKAAPSLGGFPTFANGVVEPAGQRLYCPGWDERPSGRTR